VPEPRSLAHKMACLGASRGVRATAQCRNAQFRQARTDNVVERTRRQRPEWRLQGQKNLATPTTPPNLLQIAQNRVAHLAYERILLGPPLLGTGNGNEFFFPVHVLDAQAGDFLAAESVNCKQHQHGAISNLAWLVRVGTGDETLYIGPTGTYGKSL